MDELRLAALLCTRLCHDLVGPVAAVNNGLELLAEQPSVVPDDVAALLRQSGAESARRLQFLRAAFGGSGGGEALDAARRVAHELFLDGKVALDWPDTPPPAVAQRKELPPLLLNLLLCATEMLPRGGRVAVRLAAAGDVALRVTAAGPDIKITDAARRSLGATADLAAVDPRTVQFYLASRLAAALGGAVELATPAPGTAELCLTLPPRA